MTAFQARCGWRCAIDLEERAPGRVEYHTVTASGLGVWRSSDPKVKVYKYLKQVTNVSAPASYRGFVRFRWLDAKGRVIRASRTADAACLQPGRPPEPPNPARRRRNGRRRARRHDAAA